MRAMALGVFDLAVVGGGIVGLAHAYAGARAGLRVVVIERDVRANGASIRNFGFITVSGQAAGDSWALARRTRDVWAEVAPRAGVPIEQRGLYLTVRSEEAVEVIDAFLATDMGEGCRRLSPAAFRDLAPGWDGHELQGVLHSPRELRVESRTAIASLTRYLEDAFGVVVMAGTAALEVAPPRVRTSRGVVEAGAVVVCPGDDAATLFPERLAAYDLKKCRLSMLRLADPGVRPPGTLMSDLGLVRYAGYADLPTARALEARLRAEHPAAFEQGVHLIIAQGADGTLIVGDSHHYGDLPDPFAPADAEHEILAEYARATGRTPPPVLERWTGVYPTAAGRTYLVDAPEPCARIVVVTSGTGASTGFALGERVVAALCGARVEAAA